MFSRLATVALFAFLPEIEQAAKSTLASGGQPDHWSVGVSVLAVLISALAFIWQPIQRSLDNGRIRVRLLACMVTAGGAVAVREDGKLGDSRPADFKEPGLELARIVIENRGQVPVTLTQVGLTWKRNTHNPGSRFVRIRRESFGVMDVVHLLSKDESPVKTPVRLHPFDQAVFLVDLWSLVSAERKCPAARFPINVRAFSTVAGKRRRRLSSRLAHSGWVIRQEDRPAYLEGKSPTLEDVVCWLLVRYFRV